MVDSMGSKSGRRRNVRYYAFSPILLERLRRGRHMKQAELAEAVGLSQSAISKYERNEREPDLDALKKLGRYFKIFFVADWEGIHSEEKDPLEQVQ